MKRIFLIILAIGLPLFLQAGNNAGGQSFNKRGDRDEIRVGWGFSPVYYTNSFPAINSSAYDYTLGGSYHDILVGAYSAGVFGVEYTHFFKSWLSVCAELGFTPLWDRRTNAFNEPLSPENGFMFHVLPKVRFSYLRTEIISLYSDIGLGVAAGTYGGRTRLAALFHGTPIGITVGKRVYGFAETNLGMRNIGLTIGAGYRF